MQAVLTNENTSYKLEALLPIWGNLSRIRPKILIECYSTAAKKLQLENFTLRGKKSKKTFYVFLSAKNPFVSTQINKYLINEKCTLISQAEISTAEYSRPGQAYCFI